MHGPDDSSMDWQQSTGWLLKDAIHFALLLACIVTFLRFSSRMLSPIIQVVN